MSICPKCGSINKDDSKLCLVCNSVLKKEEFPHSAPSTSINFIHHIWPFILLIWIVLIIVLIYRPWEEFIPPKIKDTIPLMYGKKGISPEKHLPEFNPYSGSYNLNIDPRAALTGTLDGMSLNQIADFRINKVREHSILNIFPPDYNPLMPPHDRIYKPITSGADWLYGAQFYISNPYLLIILTCADHITPLVLFSPVPKIKYSNRSIEEIYTGLPAKQWFDKLYSYDDYPGILRLWMVNSYDAGLFYATIDQEKSTNIDYTWNNSSLNILNSIHSQPCLFHFGRYKKNNLSPADPKGRIKLIEKDAYTCIYVKLWRSHPNNLQQQEDFAYIIKIIP